MKFLCFIFIFVASTSMALAGEKNKKTRKVASENAPFSAFVHKGVLYATVLGDSCNDMDGMLDVEESCNKNRSSMNTVTTCKATLTAVQITMGCMGGASSVPKVLTIPLKKTDVDPEAKMLELTWGNKIQVKINY